jgi:sensor c-di-GMP phosphodiesterase-like protein
VGQISTDWVLRYWHKIVVYAVALTIMSAGVLFLIFFLFFRRAQALDFDIEAGLKNNEFELHYQPIVDIETGACVGSEALIRWRHPDEGVLLPGLFIPSAEKTGLINPMGDWIVRQAIEDQSQLIDRYSLGYISINLSPIQLNSGSFDGTLKWLADAPVTHEKILIEVTEKEMIRHSHTTAMDTLARLRKLGCGVALDDFGVGNSNLSNLAKLEFGHIKIDMQFVQGINRDIRTNSILDAIVKLGRKLDLKIIAEGVETEEQRLYLQELGVRYVQGWLFSRALPIADFENYLAGQED